MTERGEGRNEEEDENKKKKGAEDSLEGESKRELDQMKVENRKGGEERGREGEEEEANKKEKKEQKISL